MKTINGKKYYISLGRFDSEDRNEPIDAHKLRSYYLEEGNQIIYVDDSDLANMISIPLFEVNSIQKKNGIYKFMPLINPRKLHFEYTDRALFIDTLGLFEVDESDGCQTIRLVSFFRCNLIFFKESDITPLCVELNERKLK